MKAHNSHKKPIEEIGWGSFVIKEFKETFGDLIDKRDLQFSFFIFMSSSQGKKYTHKTLEIFAPNCFNKY